MGGASQSVEGGWQPERMIVIQFESSARAREWYDSPEYLPLRELRQRSSGCKLIIVDGA